MTNTNLEDRAYRKAAKAQALLHGPNINMATRERAEAMLREARNMLARANGQPEQF